MIVRQSQSPGVEWARLHQRIVFGRRIDICSDSRNRTIIRVETGNTEVGNLHGFLIRSKQKVLRFDIAMDDAALVRMCETGTDLFEIEEGSLKR